MTMPLFQDEEDELEAELDVGLHAAMSQDSCAELGLHDVCTPVRSGGGWP